MKKVLTALVATAALTIATSAMAASIVNSKHNLSSNTSTSYKSTTTQVCVFCHTPHNANYTRALWNRSAPTATFALYTSGANVEQDSWYVNSSRTLPTSSPSVLCMSCHDGSTSLTTLGKAPIEASGGHVQPTIAFGDVLTGGAALGTNLTNDHPISLVYDNAYNGAPGTLVQSNAGKVGVLPLAKGQNLECNTCHNVHDPAFVPFLRVSNDNSALCVVCHVK